MGRAFSLSLAGHIAFVLSFLLLSATRQPVRIPEVVRPVRLVAYVEPAPARRAARVPAAAPRAAAPAAASPPRTLPAPEPEAAAAAPPALPAPVTVPRVVVPVRESRPQGAAPRPAAEAPPAAPALGERLSRRLAAAASPGPVAETEASAPRLAGLPAEAAPGPAARPAVGGAPDGVGTGAGGGAPVAALGTFPHAWYLAVLKEQVYARWVPPSDFFSGGRTANALVSFRIDRGGGISRLAMRQGSGSARFDRSALAAVEALGRVPPLPPQYPEESLDVVIRFQNEQ